MYVNKYTSVLLTKIFGQLSVIC